MKTKIILFSIALAFASCSKDGEIGPQGPTGPTGATGTAGVPQGGYIEGTVSGTRNDGTPFTISFNTTYYTEPDFYFGNSLNGYEFSIRRHPKFYNTNYEYTYIQFRIPSLSSTNILNEEFGMSIPTDIGNNQIFSFYCSEQDSAVTITNFSYDTVTRIAEGDFTIASNNNMTGNPATISGSFKSIVMKQIIYRKE